MTSAPPTAPKRPSVLRAHGDERIDDWYWLREKDNPEVISYLEAENAYTAEALEPLDGLRKTVYDEIVSRIQETDLSVPVQHNGWWYYTRSLQGSQYAIHCRRAVAGGEVRPPVIEAGPPGAGEQVMLDENLTAAGHDFFELGIFETSPDASLLAWSADTTGGERYTIRIRALDSGDDLADVIEDTYYSSAWGNDNRTLFYTRPNEAMRPYQIWRHTLGTPAADDVLVYQEDDERFNVGVGRTKDDQFIVIESSSKITTEVQHIPAATPTAPPVMLIPRSQGVEYEVEHQGERWVVVTNADGAVNFKLMSLSSGAWTPVVPYDPAVRLLGVDVFAEYLVLHERASGQLRIRVLPVDDPSSAVILDQPEPVHTVTLSSNPSYDSTLLRFQYTSMITPASVYDYDLATGERFLLKQQPVLGGYDPARYRTSREWAVADDGTRIPVSLVYPADLPKDGTAPCLLYGYGSYEASVNPAFSPFRLSLLERGFVFAIAHVRGGGEMGRQWYEDGKFLHKTNTFTDFVAAAAFLIDGGWTSAARLVARGGSAGGLLMGAVANLRPDLFRAIVAEVPFVDCLTTILDDTLPLTAMEWEEWGNPVADAEFYNYMKSYSPYDCVSSQAYPAMLVTAGLNDPRVSYWEPAKWVLRLRERKTDDRTIVLKTEMGAGHMGPSGRYDAWRDEALTLSFIVDAVS